MIKGADLMTASQEGVDVVQVENDAVKKQKVKCKAQFFTILLYITIVLLMAITLFVTIYFDIEGSYDPKGKLGAAYTYIVEGKLR